MNNLTIIGILSYANSQSDFFDIDSGFFTSGACEYAKAPPKIKTVATLCHVVQGLLNHTTDTTTERNFLTDKMMVNVRGETIELVRKTPLRQTDCAMLLATSHAMRDGTKKGTNSNGSEFSADHAASPTLLRMNTKGTNATTCDVNMNSSIISSFGANFFSTLYLW